MISICIPCKNDQEELDRQVETILSTATQDFEIVVCDDGSDRLIQNKHCKIVRHRNTIGVGAAIDKAVRYSSGDTIVISGSDIVHFDNKWMDVVVPEREIVCSPVRSYDPENDRYGNERYGCKMIIKASRSDIPPSRRYAFPENWQMLYRSKWLHDIDKKTEVSSILGAKYYIKKSWYETLRGFQLHRYWGSLDSFIAMKSWLAGGKCTIDPSTSHGHVYSRTTSSKPQDWFMYNKIMVTRVLFPEAEGELLEWISGDKLYESGLNLANSFIPEISEMRDYLQSIFVKDYDWYKELCGG